MTDAEKIQAVREAIAEHDYNLEWHPSGVSWSNTASKEHYLHQADEFIKYVLRPLGVVVLSDDPTWPDILLDMDIDIADKAGFRRIIVEER